MGGRGKSSGGSSSRTGRTIIPSDKSKTFFSESRANSFVEQLKSKGVAKDVSVESRRDAFNQEEYTVKWNVKGKTKAK